VRSINKDDRWTVDELVGKASELFGDLPTSPQRRTPVSSGAVS
jgi:hypothetical protein